MSDRIVCNLCSTSFATEKQYKRHLKTKKHINNVDTLEKISHQAHSNNLKNEKDKDDIYVYTKRDFEETTNAYEKVIKELNIELELLKYQLESSKSEKLSVHFALKNAEEQLDSNYKEINKINEHLEKYRMDLGDMMDKNTQLETRIKERFCCFSFT